MIFKFFGRVLTMALAIALFPVALVYGLITALVLWQARKEKYGRHEHHHWP